jgi:hypothetical protein
MLGESLNEQRCCGILGYVASLFFERVYECGAEYLYFERRHLIMSNVVFANTYKLKNGASVPDFLLAVEKLIKEYVSKQKGYVSFQLLAENDTWADSVTFETMDNLNAFLETSEAAQANGTNDLAEKFYSFLNFNTCKSNIYSVVKSY